MYSLKKAEDVGFFGILSRNSLSLLIKRGEEEEEDEEEGTNVKTFNLLELGKKSNCLSSGGDCGCHGNEICPE